MDTVYHLLEPNTGYACLPLSTTITTSGCWIQHSDYILVSSILSLWTYHHPYVSSSWYFQSSKKWHCQNFMHEYKVSVGDMREVTLTLVVFGSTVLIDEKLLKLWSRINRQFLLYMWLSSLMDASSDCHLWSLHHHDFTFSLQQR